MPEWPPVKKHVFLGWSRRTKHGYDTDLLGARVIAVDINPVALKFASEMGTWKTINPNECEDIKAEILGLTDGLGPDISFDACGDQGMFNVAMEITMPGGTVMTVGHGHHGIDLVRERLSFHADPVSVSQDYCGRAR